MRFRTHFSRQQHLPAHCGGSFVQCWCGGDSFLIMKWWHSILKISLKAYTLLIFYYIFISPEGNTSVLEILNLVEEKWKIILKQRGTVILWKKNKSSGWAVFTSGFDFSNAVIIHPPTDSYHPACIQAFKSKTSLCSPALYLTQRACCGTYWLNGGFCCVCLDSWETMVYKEFERKSEGLEHYIYLYIRGKSL